MRAAAQVDAKIVEVALFFQRELESAMAPAGAEAASESVRPAVSVLLLSADNAQVGAAHSYYDNVIRALFTLWQWS